MNESEAALVGRRPDGVDVIRVISQRLAEKRVPARSMSAADSLVAALGEPGLVTGSPDDRAGQWLELFACAEHLWDAAAQLWRGGFSAPAAALAVSTLDETAKLAVERFRVAGVKANAPVARVRTRSKSDRRTRHLMAAMQEALINDRVDVHLGVIEVDEFLGLVGRGELEGLRHSCLHADPGAERPSSPRNAVTRERSAWIVALAGEVLAEIHFQRGEWERFLAKVDAFEQAAGIQTPGHGDAPDYSRWTVTAPSVDACRCGPSVNVERRNPQVC